MLIDVLISFFLPNAKISADTLQIQLSGKPPIDTTSYFTSFSFLPVLEELAFDAIELAS